MSAWLGAALAGLSGLSGLIPKKQVSTTSTDQTTLPTYDPASLSFRDMLMRMFTENIKGDNTFGDNLRTEGLQNIGNTSNLAARSFGDILSSRGINRTTAGSSALGDVSYKSGRDISAFLNHLPLLLDQRKQDLLSGAGSFFSSLPTGSRVTGTSRTEGTVPGGFSGLLQGGSEGLATYLGQLNAQKNLSKILDSWKNANSGTGGTGFMKKF